MSGSMHTLCIWTISPFESDCIYVLKYHYLEHSFNGIAFLFGTPNRKRNKEVFNHVLCGSTITIVTSKPFSLFLLINHMSFISQQSSGIKWCNTQNMIISQGSPKVKESVNNLRGTFLVKFYCNMTFRCIQNLQKMV